MKYLQYLVMVALLLLLAACGQTQVPEAAPIDETAPTEQAAPSDKTLQATATYGSIVGTVHSDGIR